MDEIPLNQDQRIALAVLFCLAVIYGLSIWRRRHNAAYNLGWLALASVGGLLIWAFLQTNEEIAPFSLYLAIFATVIFYRLRPAKKRSMRAETRRRVISKWQLKTGKKFNPRFHEIDHTVPFSLGGNETEDNLRVIDRKTNRSKGAKGPWWDVMGR